MTKETKTINNKVRNLVNFSKNQKLNKVLNQIYNDLLTMCDTEQESIAEIKRYAKEHNKELDYNLYRYGNLIIYNDGIIDLYKDYKSLKSASIEKLIKIYCRQIRYIANYIINNNK